MPERKVRPGQENVMLNTLQRRTLIETMITEPLRAWLVLARCAAGLAAIVLIAVIGNGESADRRTTGNPTAESIPPAANSAQAHRKQVFEARRVRFDDSGRTRNVAGHAVRQFSQAPLVLR
jgi:hypothetical protein